MLLSVIVPDTKKGMARMLEKELAGIDAEVIKKPWISGIKKAKGDFVCLLEANSAVSPGTIKNNLREFIENPKYRKLAMVSPRVDLANKPNPLSWTFTRSRNGRTGVLAAYLKPASQEFHSVRVGHAPGAIIRRSSLLKANLPYNLHPYVFSTCLSLFFWENGLRIALQPESLYYAPENVSYASHRKRGYKNQPTPTVWHIWEREMIS